MFYAEPVTVDANADDLGVEAKRIELQTKLNEAARLGELWRKGQAAERPRAAR